MAQLFMNYWSYHETTSNNLNDCKYHSIQVKNLDISYKKEDENERR